VPPVITPPPADVLLLPPYFAPGRRPIAARRPNAAGRCPAGAARHINGVSEFMKLVSENFADSVEYGALAESV